MAIINITDFSGAFQSNIEPTWAKPSDAANCPIPSEDKNPITGHIIYGRGDHMSQLYDSNRLGLNAYNPRALFVELMSGDSELALGAQPTAAAGQYFGASVTTDHLTYAKTPNLSNVDTAKLNIPNPYVPDISAGAASAKDYKEEFESKHSGIRNSFPPKGATPSSEIVETSLDLNAGDGTLNPSATKDRLGGWMSDSVLEYGRWQAQ
jgi:hypothetical protein